MSSSDTEGTDRTKLRKSALVSVVLPYMVIELSWSPELGGRCETFGPGANDPQRNLWGVFQQYAATYEQNPRS